MSKLKEIKVTRYRQVTVYEEATIRVKGSPSEYDIGAYLRKADEAGVASIQWRIAKTKPNAYDQSYRYKVEMPVVTVEEVSESAFDHNSLLDEVPEE